MKEGLIDRVIDNLEKRRQRVLHGGINCIPSPFMSFRRDFPGIEQGKFYIVSGASKSGKSQITNYLFLFTPILYAYHHPEKVRVKIFYFPLEETAEKITLRFMSYLLYTLSDHAIRISPTDLRSVSEGVVVDEEILKLLKSREYQDILRFYEEHVLFMSDRNPTGVWKIINTYAEESGVIHRKKVVIENKKTGVKQETEVFDYYEPKDPDEYVEIIWDHVSLTGHERGMNLKESIDKLSEYFMIFRNKFNYIPIALQQQNSETISLDAFKANKIKPSLSGLSDSKNTGKDCSMMLGVTNPFAFEMNPYLGYDISKLKGYARFLEVVLNREGESNGVIALYFDGATNYFTPLPSANDQTSLRKVYSLIERNNNPNARTPAFKQPVKPAFFSKSKSLLLQFITKTTRRR